MKHSLTPVVLAVVLAFGPHLARAQAPAPDINRPPPASDSVAADQMKAAADLKQQTEEIVRQSSAIARRAQLDAQNAFRDVQSSFMFLNSDALTGAGTAGTLMIPRETADPKVLAEVEEDLTVMSRILDKAMAREEKKPSAMGIPVNRKSGPASRTLYIEGYGALFFFNVNFPLIPPTAENAEAQPKPDTSSEWEEARRELSRPPGFTLREPGLERPAFDNSIEEYDARRVEELKQNLISALKNAAHIRRLRADELVMVVVSGRGSVNSTKPLTRSSRGADETFSLTGINPAARGTKLIIRARRSDIEPFQKGNISEGEFRKKITILVY